MRARNIKPATFKNELLGEADPLLTILFIGLWCMADCRGVLEDRPKRIKAEIFPYREISDLNIFLNDLEIMGFIARYFHSGTALIQILTFNEHQNPHPTEKSSGHPVFTDADGLPDLNIKNNFEKLFKNASSLNPSSLIPDSLNDDSPTFETSASDAETVESEKTPSDEKREAYLTAKPLIVEICKARGKLGKVPMATQAEWETIVEVFEFWVSHFGKNAGTKLTPERGRHILDRLRPPVIYSVDDIKEAIQGCKLSPYHNGKSGETGGKVYDDIELICRDSTKLEKFRGTYEAYKDGTINSSGNGMGNGNGTGGYKRPNDIAVLEESAEFYRNYPN